VVASGHPASAQTVQVTGTVTAVTTPIRNATITFQEKDNPAVLTSTQTDSAGRYRVALTLTSTE
jgi:hypothetical protein